MSFLVFLDPHGPGRIAHAFEVRQSTLDTTLIPLGFSSLCGTPLPDGEVRRAPATGRRCKRCTRTAEGRKGGQSAPPQE